MSKPKQRTQCICCGGLTYADLDEVTEQLKVFCHRCRGETPLTDEERIAYLGDYIDDLQERIGVLENAVLEW